MLERFAEALGASAESGMLGSPSTTVNGRGAVELAGDVVAADREAGSAAAKAQVGELSAVLLLGDDSFDPDDRAGLGAQSYVPSLNGWDGTFGRVASENRYADATVPARP